MFLSINSFVFCLTVQYWQLIQNRNCYSAFKNSNTKESFFGLIVKEIYDTRQYAEFNNAIIS